MLSINGGASECKPGCPMTAASAGDTYGAASSGYQAEADFGQPKRGRRMCDH